MRIYKKISALLCFFVLTVLITFFIIKTYEPTINSYNFIDLFDSAEKTGFRPDDINDQYLPGYKYLTDISYLHPLIVKTFSQQSFLLNSNGIERESIDESVSDGCFRTVFKKIPARSAEFDYSFKKKNPNDYWQIKILTGGKIMIEITYTSKSVRYNVDRIEVESKMIEGQKLNILFIADFLFIFTDKDMLFQCRHQALSGKGTSSFSYHGSSLNTVYSVKFGIPSNEIKKQFAESLAKQYQSIPEHKYNYTESKWNLLGREDDLAKTGIYNGYIKRLKLKNTTMPSIYFLPGYSIKYELDIPPESILSFGLVFYIPDGLIPEDRFFYIKIASKNGKFHDEYKYRLKEFEKTAEEFRRYRINLDKYYGKKCMIEFGFSCKKNEDDLSASLYPKIPVAVLASPAIYSVRGKNDKNIILISLDTLRPDHLGIYGYERNTSPNIDSFARNSILFLNATAQSNWTLTSHMSIFSSLYPFETGYNKNSNIHQTVRFAEKIKLIQEYLKEDGYKTGAITGGGYLSEYFGYDKGMDYYTVIEKKVGPVSKSDCSNSVDEAMKWIKESENVKFFLFFHTYEIHKPFNHTDFLKDLNPETADSFDKTIARYDSGILFTDRQIGRMIEWLKKEKLFGDTIIIITSDHGENFSLKDRENIPGMHGVTLYDSEIQVPLIIGGAIDGKNGTVIKNQVSLVDIMPTIFDYLNISAPDDIRGMSLKELIEGDEKGERLAYSEAVFSGDEKKSLRSVEYKLIKNTVKAGTGQKEFSEFYNLGKDRGERTNLINSGLHTIGIFLSRLEAIIAAVKERRKALLIKTEKAGGHNKELENQLKALGYIGN